MDRCDAEQEGITLSPVNTTRLVAEGAARQVVMEHLSLCPFGKANCEQRLRALETNFARLIGFMLGSGALGGATGAILSHLLRT